MQRGERNGIIAIHGLAADDLAEVTALAERCNRHEALDLPLYLPAAATQPDSERCQFLHYSHRALTGYFACDSDNEACGMVHPDYRRRGIGRALVKAVHERQRQRGTARWFLICDEASSSGPAFARAVGAQRRFAEYRMEWTGNRVPVPGPTPPPLSLQPASLADLDLFARVLAGAFDDPEEEARRRFEPRFLEAERRFYIARCNGHPVGTVGLYEEGSAVYITSFGVLPAWHLHSADTPSVEHGLRG
jgi:GNAT superfamily N-acetyltransferase